MRRFILLLPLFTLLFIGSARAQLGNEDSTYDLRVKAILDDIGYKYDITDNGDFKIVIALDSDRTQAVYVKSATEFYDEMEVREIWSFGYSCTGPLPADVANKLLQNSFDQKIGAWQVASNDSVSIAIFAIKMSANADETSVKSAIIAAVRNADAVEMDLTGKDDEF